jgi:hypothetical protein
MVILIINWHSKPEYLSPTIPMIMAGAAIVTERSLRKWMNLVVIVLMGTGIVVMPLALPMLPVQSFIKYYQTLGLAPANTESQELNELPQHFADMFGWENMAKEVSKAYGSLSDADKIDAVVFAQNYGEAAALDYYRKKYPIPRVLCLHNNYWLWGWRHIDKSMETVIIVGGQHEDHVDNFESVTPIGVIRCQYCIPYENNLTLHLCKNLKGDIEEIWKREKVFI